MSELKRPSGVEVSITGPIKLARPAAPPKRGTRKAVKRTAKPGYDELLLSALARQDLELIDTIPLAVPPSAQPKRRGAAAPPSQINFDVALGADEQAVVLLDDEGVYRWIVDGVRLPSTAPKRRGALSGKRVRFTAEVMAAPPPPAIAVKRGGAKRNWLAEKVVGKVTAYIFRFAFKAVGKKIVSFLERKVEQGLVAMTAPDPTKWTLLDDNASLPFTLPSDRPARVLLFVHGTFSSTAGSFGALGITPQGSAFLSRALADYDAVIGFDHPTLSVDPQKNAKDLLQRLRKVKWPRPPHIELVCFSRGGLVARSLVEQLLPQSSWKATVGRMVFVGCTNGGTLLAEPSNWHRFADHYTNLALGATRALSLFPGAQGVGVIAGGVIRGVSILIRALATGIVTDKLAPGLAAMQPDGDFVKAINKTQAGQPSAKQAQYFAVTSDFSPRKALSTGNAPELPPKLLLRLANWGADEVLDEANDLVVHVRSMTQIDPAVGGFVKDVLDYGSNGAVYHTNYFTRDATAAKLIDWLGLVDAAAAPVPKRSPSKKGAPKKAAPIKRRAAPSIGKKPAMRPDAGGSPSSRTAKKVAKRPPSIPPAKKVAARKTSSAPTSGKATKKAAAKKASATSSKRRPAPKSATKKAALKAARRRAAKKPAFSSSSPVSVDYSYMGSGPAPRRKKPSHVKEPTQKRTASKKVVAVPKKPKASGSTRGNKANDGSDSLQVNCHFRAEMDSEVVVEKTTSVDLTIAQTPLPVTVGRAGDSAEAPVDATRKLIVQIAERRNFRVDGERRVEVDVPLPGEEVNVSFDVTGLTADADGELWVQVRQGPVPLVTLKLRTRIVATKSAGAVARVPMAAEISMLPRTEPALDTLTIDETFVGEGVQYRYSFDLPSLGIRKRFESKLIHGRDAYVTNILNRIGNAWVGNGKADFEAFETDLRAIGGMMFEELMPRDMQELLWENRNKITSVQVFSMEPFIPWELTFLKNPKKGPIDDNSKFLGELGLVRWLYEGYPPSQLSIKSGRVRYVIPTYKGDQELPNSVDEEKMMKRLFKATAVKPRALDVQKLIRQPGSFDLLHFGGHAEAAGVEQDDARLLLEEVDGGSTENALRATTVAQIAELNDNGVRPMVVLNACESARMHRGFGSMGGFATAFVEAGAGVFVGTHWSVGDAPALTYIRAFYEAFTTRKRGAKPLELREAMAVARDAARKNGGDATWLAYVVYGHPRAIVM